jgi:arsenite methyltransferase
MARRPGGAGDEKVPGGAQAAGLAAFDLVQKVFLLLIERGFLSVMDAQVILRDSIAHQQRLMDTDWTPVNEAAAELLTRFSKAVTQASLQGLPVRQRDAQPPERRSIMETDVAVDAERLREEVRAKYREVAVNPTGSYHFHTGRPLAARLGYDEGAVGAMPDAAVESFAGVANPFSLRTLVAGEKVVDIGSGGGFDCFVAAGQVGPSGHVVGVDMTAEMLAKSRATAAKMGLAHVEFREGIAEALPVEDGWADVVISNGVINLCADKRLVFNEIRRVLRPGGHLQFADIANGKPVPESAIKNIDLWTA